MGYYTTLCYDPGDGKGGREIQFKAYDRDFKRYQLGDKVDRWISPTQADEYSLYDGVYAGCCYLRENDEFEDWIVVIKDQHIVEATPFNGPGFLGDALEETRKRYDISLDPPRDLWSEELWEKKRLEDEERQRKYDKELRQACIDRGLDPDNLSLEDKSAVELSLYTRAIMKQDGFFRKILPPITTDIEVFDDAPRKVIDN